MKPWWKKTPHELWPHISWSPDSGVTPYRPLWMHGVFWGLVVGAVVLGLAGMRGDCLWAAYLAVSVVVLVIFQAWEPS